MIKKSTYEELEKKIQELEQAKSEHKQTEKPSLNEKNILHNILESIEDGVYIVNQKCDIQYVNPVLAKEFGSYEEDKCYRYFHDLDKICPWCKNQDVWAGKTVRWEWSSIKSKKIYDLIDTPMALPDGSIGKLGLFRDITKMKKAENKLLKNQYFLQKSQEIGQIGTWELDVLKNKLSWTDETYRIFGIPIGTELTYEIFLNCVHPDDREYVDTEWKAAFNKKPYDIEHRLLVGGKVKWVREKAELEFDEKNECIRGTGFVQNTTERKKAEESLRISQLRFSRIEERLKNKFLFYNRSVDGEILYIGPGSEAISGLPPNEIVGKNWKEVVPWTPEALEQGKKSEDRLRAGESNVEGVEMPMYLKNGEILYLQMEQYTLKNDDGSIIEIEGIIQDITERKKLEKKLEKWNEELEKKVTEKAGSLSDVNTALRVLLKKREKDKNQISENIYTNYKSLIKPLLKQLRNRHTKNIQEDILDVLESSIKDMITPFSKKLSDPMVGLTPTEIQVALLVKEGKTNKEIAQILIKSIRAVSAHRENIRQKFGLKKTKINLRTYLLSL